MATYVTKKCPNCRYAYQRFQSGEQRKYGCPLLTCPRCGSLFWDTDIKEPALHGFKNEYETRAKISRILYSIVVFPVATGFLVISVWGIIIERIWMLLLLAALCSWILWVICSWNYRVFFDKSGKRSTTIARQMQYDQSLERLQHLDYVEELSKHDKMAARYLEAVNSGIPWKYAERPILNGRDISESTESKTWEYSPVNCSAEANNQGKYSDVRYCHRCGHQLLEESNFCDMCGTKIV